MKWLGLGLAALVIGYAGVVWFSGWMSEGVVETETPRRDVLVALSKDPQVSQALLDGCRSTGGFPSSISPLLASGLLVHLPPGTKVHMPFPGSDPFVGTVTVAEGPLKGHQVWACRGQFIPVPERIGSAALDLAGKNVIAITALGQLLVMLLTGLITTYVYFYTRRRDKLEFFYNNWNKQQDVNIQCLLHDEVLRIVEELVYGNDQVFDVKKARAFTFAFLHLNKIQNNYQAMKQGVLSKKEYLEMSLPTLRLFARNKKLIIYLVSQRGYGDQFRDNIIECLKSIQPYDVQPFSGDDSMAKDIDIAAPPTKRPPRLLNVALLVCLATWRTIVAASRNGQHLFAAAAHKSALAFAALRRAAPADDRQTTSEQAPNMTSPALNEPINPPGDTKMPDGLIPDAVRGGHLRRAGSASVEWLYQNLSWLLYSKWFYYLSFTFLLNPILLGIQLHRALNTHNTESLSSVMFCGFAFLNIVTGLAGLKIRNTPMILSCAASAIMAVLIVVVTIS